MAKRTAEWTLDERLRRALARYDINDLTNEVKRDIMNRLLSEATAPERTEEERMAAVVGYASMRVLNTQYAELYTRALKRRGEGVTYSTVCANALMHRNDALIREAERSLLENDEWHGFIYQTWRMHALGFAVAQFYEWTTRDETMKLLDSQWFLTILIPEAFIYEDNAFAAQSTLAFIHDIISRKAHYLRDAMAEFWGAVIRGIVKYLKPGDTSFLETLLLQNTKLYKWPTEREMLLDYMLMHSTPDVWSMVTETGKEEDDEGLNAILAEMKLSINADRIVKVDRPDLLEWALAHPHFFTKSNAVTTQNVFYAAIFNGTIKNCEWLLQHYPNDFKLNRKAYYDGALGGGVAFLDWLELKGVPKPIASDPSHQKSFINAFYDTNAWQPVKEVLAWYKAHDVPTIAFTRVSIF